MQELAGRAIIVTGAGGGLGREYALAVANAGGKLVVNDACSEDAASVVDLIQKSGGAAVVSAEPVGTQDAADRLIALCVQTYGRIDGLINNAGLHTKALSWDMDPPRAEAIVQVNLLGTIHNGLAAIQHMRSQGAGTIINVGSGAMLGQKENSIYGATKAAILSLTRSWAKELQSEGVRVYCLSPYALTAMLQSLDKSFWAGHGPEIVAPLAVYLLTDRASFLHGQMVRIADGRLSLFNDGSFGPTVGDRLDWTSDSLDAALHSAKLQDLQAYHPVASHGS